MSHSKFPVEKATLATNARIFFAAPHNTRHAPLCSPDLLSFTIYPTCEADIAQNDFLWHVVHDSSFPLAEGRRIISKRLQIAYPHLAGTPATLFALALPEALADFLEAVSLQEMHRSIVYMLADAAQGEDARGLRNMRSNLAPGIWLALRRLLIRCSREFSNGITCSSASFMLDTALQTSYDYDYWKVDVDASLFIPARHSAFHVMSNDARAASVLASLYADWATYTANELVWEVCLPDDKNAKEASRARQRRKIALETMMRLVRRGTQSETWERVSALRRCAENQQTWLAKLPSQIVEHLLIPKVFLDDGDDDDDDDDDYENDEYMHGRSQEMICIQHEDDDDTEAIAASEMHRLPST